MKRQYLVVGAGLSGAVVARELAEAGHRVSVREARDHVAGNCHTERDAQTGVMVHRYGPHIFHTDDTEVWAYVNQFTRFRPYAHKVKAQARGQVYTLPMNLHTINQFFGLTLRPDEARAFLARQARSPTGPIASFEDQAVAWLGEDLYRTFFEGYTRKQWGRAPVDLPASILKRLPLRFNYDDRYFNHRFQAMPEQGYTAMVSRMLDHPLIDIRLNTPVRRSDVAGFDHVFCTAAIDAWFGHMLGHLGYRTLRFEEFHHDGDYQGCAVMNYPDPDCPFTRITEHKHFAPWEEHAQSVVYREYARDCAPGDTPFYPIRLLDEKALLSDYVALAERERNVSFLGRLGTYRYLDMDRCIREALDCARTHLAALADGAPLPVFSVAPI